MKTTAYFLEALERPAGGVSRFNSAKTWERAEYTEVQEDGRVRFWGYVPARDLYLRVVALPDRETLLNAFWDESFTRRRRREP